MTPRPPRLIALAAQLLDPAEREIVLGDLAEARTSGVTALADILGLAARRQLEAWGELRPWLTLVFLVLPVGLLLSVVSRVWGDAVITTAKFFAFHFGDWTYFANPSLRSFFLHYIWHAILPTATLFCWSWTCGMAIGALTKRTSWTTAVLFSVMLFIGTLGTMTVGRAEHIDANPYSPFAPVLFGVILPPVFRILIAALPAFIAVVRTPGPCSRRPRNLLMWSAVAVALTLAMRRETQISLFFGWVTATARGRLAVLPVLGNRWISGAGGISWSDDMLVWPLRVLPFITLLPIVCILTSGVWRHQRVRSAKANTT